MNPNAGLISILEAVLAETVTEVKFCREVTW